VFVLVFFEMGGVSLFSQAGLELIILLSQPFKCWDYRCRPPYLIPIHQFLKEIMFLGGHLKELKLNKNHFSFVS
jgi:hypothetical protein